MLVPPSNFGMVEEDLYRSGAPDLINLAFLEKLRLKSLLWLAPEEPDRDLQTFCATHQIALYHLGTLPRLAATGAGGNTSSGGLLVNSSHTGSAAAAAAAHKALSTGLSGGSSSGNSASSYAAFRDRSEQMGSTPRLGSESNGGGRSNHNTNGGNSGTSNSEGIVSVGHTNGMAGSSTIMGGGGAWEPITEDLVLSALQLLVNPATYPAIVMCNQGRHRTGTVIGCLRKLQRWCLSSILEEYRRFAGPKVRVMNEQFIELFDIDLVFE